MAEYAQNSVVQIVESLPESFLEKLPALNPPPGLTSNLVNPPDKGPAVAAVASVFAGLAFALVLVRIYSKCFIFQKWTWDDVTFAFGVAFGIIFYAANMRAYIQGPYGINQWNVSVAQIVNKDNMLIPSWLILFSSPSLAFLKLTLFIFQWNMFWPYTWFRICAYIGATVSTSFYLATTIALLVFTTPSIHQTWLESVLSPHEIRATQVSVPNGSVGLAIDLWLLIIPFFVLYPRRLQTNQKLKIALLFSLGLLACVSSAVSIYYRYRADFTSDVTGSVSYVDLLCMMEIFVGMIIACLPSLAKLLREGRAPSFESLESMRDRLIDSFSRIQFPIFTRRPSAEQVLPAWYGSTPQSRTPEMLGVGHSRDNIPNFSWNPIGNAPPQS